MNTKYKELSGNTLIFAIGTLGSKLILFFMVPLYTNLLSTAEYGTADLVQTMSSLFVPIFSIMIQDSVLRFGLSKNVDNKNVLKNSLLVSFLGALVALVLIPLMLLYKPISEWAIYLYGILITNMLSNVLLSYVKTINRNKLYSLCGIISTFMLAGLNVIFLVVFHMGIRGYLLSIIVSQVFSCVSLFWGADLGKRLKGVKVDFVLLKQMILYSLPLIANNLSWWILNSSDKLMVEYYCGVDDLGIYTAASKIPALISIINTIFLQAWTISSIKDYEQEKDANFFSNTFSMYSVTMIGVTSAVLLVIKQLMHYYVGIEYQDSWRFVPLLLYGTVFYGFSLFFGTIYSAAKKNIYIALSTGASAIINIIINLILLPQIGVIAAAISTAASYFVVGTYRMLDSKRFFKFDVNTKSLVLNSLILLFQTISVTLEWHSVGCSLVSVIALLVVNRKTVISIPKFMINLIHNRE